MTTAELNAAEIRMAVKRKISLVLLDVDGTLVNEQKVLTEAARAAVAKLHSAGIRFTITSGRPAKGMAMLFGPLALDTPIAGFNGGLFVEPDLTILAQKTVSADVARRAVNLICHHGLDAWVYSGNDWLITRPDAPHVAREAWTVKFDPKVVADFSDSLDQVVKVVGVSDDRDLVRLCEADAQAVSASKRRRTARNPPISTSPADTRTKARSWTISRITWACRSRRSPPSVIRPMTY